MRVLHRQRFMQTPEKFGQAFNVRREHIAVQLVKSEISISFMEFAKVHM
jgi:hypothetical protein